MRSSESQAQVIAFLAAFYAGDVQRTLACCDDDIKSMVYLPVELFPHLAPRQGKQAVATLVELHVARYSERRHQVTFITADRLRVAAILELSFTKRSDGRVMKFASGNFFTLRRGLITELQTFFDTLDMIEQLTGRDLVAPARRARGLAASAAPAAVASGPAHQIAPGEAPGGTRIQASADLLVSGGAESSTGRQGRRSWPRVRCAATRKRRNRRPTRTSRRAAPRRSIRSRPARPPPARARTTRNRSRFQSALPSAAQNASVSVMMASPGKAQRLTAALRRVGAPRAAGIVDHHRNDSEIAAWRAVGSMPISSKPISMAIPTMATAVMPQSRTANSSGVLERRHRQLVEDRLARPRRQLRNDGEARAVAQEPRLDPGGIIDPLQAIAGASP